MVRETNPLSLIPTDSVTTTEEGNLLLFSTPDPRETVTPNILHTRPPPNETTRVFVLPDDPSHLGLGRSGLGCGSETGSGTAPDL